MVSNLLMRRLFVRLAIYLLGAGAAITLSVVLIFYSVTRREVRIAQQMMGDASQLQIEKSGLNDVFCLRTSMKAMRRDLRTASHASNLTVS